MNLARWKHVVVKTLAVLLALALVVGVIAGSVYLAGPVDTVLYVFLFLLGAGGIPAVIAFGAPSFPTKMRKTLGKLHWILGQAAYGTGYLVEFEDEYQMCPGTKHEVYIDGDWHDIDGGETNVKILGWRPFGMIRWKDQDTLIDARADPYAERSTTRANGGTGVERAGYKEKSPPATISGDEGTWLVDLKRVVTAGVRKMGDIDVVEKAEEIIMRKESRGGRTDGYETIIATVSGLVIGSMMGYVVLMV